LREPASLERFGLDSAFGRSSRAGRLAWALGLMHLLAACPPPELLSLHHFKANG
jgi:hypothetical protein